MPIYLCHEGHKHRSQEGAVNCGHCKRNQRKLVERKKPNGPICLFVSTGVLNYIRRRADEVVLIKSPRKRKRK